MKSTVAVKMSLWYSFHWPDLNKASTGFRDIQLISYKKYSEYTLIQWRLSIYPCAQVAVLWVPFSWNSQYVHICRSEGLYKWRKCLKIMFFKDIFLKGFTCKVSKNKTAFGYNMYCFFLVVGPLRFYPPYTNGLVVHTN